MLKLWYIPVWPSMNPGPCWSKKKSTIVDMMAKKDYIWTNKKLVISAHRSTLEKVTEVVNGFRWRKTIKEEQR